MATTNTDKKKRFEIDRDKHLVRDHATGTVAQLLQTQVARFRDSRNNTIRTEVLHYCKAHDGTIFVIDESD